MAPASVTPMMSTAKALTVGVVPERMAAVAAQFNLPAQVIPVAGIALGWPGQQREARTPYNPACVHRERW